MQNLVKKIWILIEGILYWLFSKAFFAIGREMTDKTFESFMQFVKFCIVGLTNTLISYAIYLVMLIFLKSVKVSDDYNYLIAQATQFIISVAWSFYWNNKMVFTLNTGETRSWWWALIKTYVSYSFTGLFLSSVLLYVWIQVFHLSEYVAPIFNLIVSIPVNFLINKYWAFKKK